MAPARDRHLAGWIVLAGLALRLPHLEQGLVEFHGWRQADGAMVAANLVRDGFDLFHPRVDWVGDLPGYVGMELPLVPLLTSLLFALFGEHLALGRLVSLAFFPPACLFLYRLVKLDFGPRVACLALAFFATSPLGIFYSRALMPEGAMLCAMLGALYFARRWAAGGRERDRWLATASAAIAMLVKLPAGVVLLPMAGLAWRRDGWSFLRSRRHWLSLAVALIPPLLWYAHAAVLAASHEPFHFFGEQNWLWSTGPGVLLDRGPWLRFIQRNAALLLTPLGIVAAAIGSRVLLRSPARAVYLAWGAGLLVALLLLWRGQVHHEYYQLPLVPWCAVLAALGVDRLAFGSATPHGSRLARAGPRVAALAGAAALQLALAVALAETRSFSERDWHLWNAGRWVAANTPREALLVATDGADPVLLYRSGRRGWHFPPGVLRDRRAPWSFSELEALRARGASHFVAVRRQQPGRQDTSFLRQLVVRRFPAIGADPMHESALLDAHPEFLRQLEARYPIVARGAFAVLYDLRPERAPATAGPPAAAGGASHPSPGPSRG